MKPAQNFNTALAQNLGTAPLIRRGPNSQRKHSSYADGQLGPLLTSREAAARLRCSLKKLQLLRRSRQIESYVLGHRTVRIPERAVENYLARHRRRVQA